MGTTSRSTEQDRDRKTLAAIAKYLSKMTSITIAGVTYTPAEFTQLFETDMQIADAATQARANLGAAAIASRDQTLKMRPIRVGFRAFLLNTFTDPSVIAEFGYSPRKVGEKTVDTKAATVAKSKATRAARHTMGKNQKSAIHGSVVGVVVTPVTTAPPTNPATAATAAAKPGS